MAICGQISVDRSPRVDRLFARTSGQQSVGGANVGPTGNNMTMMLTPCESQTNKRESDGRKQINQRPPALTSSRQ